LSLQPLDEEGLGGKLAIGPGTVVLLEVVEHALAAFRARSKRTGICRLVKGSRPIGAPSVDAAT
jgi:hypothetical protein